MNRFLLPLIGACLLGLLVLGGCGPSSGAKDEREQGGKTPEAVIGVSVLTLTNPFFRDLADAMKDEAARHNYELIVTSGELLVANQKDQINDFIVKKVNAIVLCPCDSKAIGTSIVKANKAGIPVFTADIASTAQEAEVVCHVASDNLGGGREAAKAVIEMLSGKGKVVVIDRAEVESAMLRVQGFKEQLAKAPDIELLGILPGYGDKKQSFTAAEDALQSHPDLDGIFGINDPAALGIVAAVEKAGKAGRVQVVGFDAMPEGRIGVKDGKLYATIVQYPDQIGRKTIDAIARYRAGEEVEPKILIPCTIYRKADADIDPTLAASQ